MRTEGTLGLSVHRQHLRVALEHSARQATHVKTPSLGQLSYLNHQMERLDIPEKVDQPH